MMARRYSARPGRVLQGIALATLLLVALLLGAGPARAAEKAEKEEAKGPTPEQVARNMQKNEACFECHSEAGVAKPPKPDMDLKKLRKLIRDKATYLASDHQKLACTKCHNEGYDDFPHAADAKDNTSNCDDCHQKKANRAQAEFDKSVHAKNLADKFTCNTCHNPHLMRRADKLGEPTKIVAQDNRVCLGCHDSDERFAQFAPEKKSRPLIDEIHSWLPNTRSHWQAVRCVECHTPLVASAEPISHQILDKKKAERKCISCHSQDTQLKVRLYRHLASTSTDKFGFSNPEVLTRSYVIGATRNPLVDKLMIGLAAVTLLGVLLHGVLRLVSYYIRRSKKHE